MDENKVEQIQNDSIHKFIRGMNDYSTNNSTSELGEDNAPGNKDEVNFADLLNILNNDKWLIISIASFFMFLGLTKAMLDPPAYKLDALLKVEATSKDLGELDPMEELLDNEIPVLAEIAVIKSRMVLGNAVENLGLDVVAEPNYYSFFGEAIARRFSLRNRDMLSSPLFGYTEFAWGGEEIEVKFFDVPRRWLGKKFTLIAGEKGQYKITDNLFRVVAEGKVGALLDSPVKGQEKPFQLFISTLKARSGTHFTLVKYTKLHAIGTLQKRISIKEQDEHTGILNFSMESETPEIAMQTLNEVADIYVRFNIEQKSGNAEKTLAFLEEQVVRVKNQLDLSTIKLNEYRKQKGSIDFNVETKGLLSDVAGLKTQVTVLQQKKDELHRNFTASHPSVIAIDKQIKRLKNQLYSHNKRISDLPETQQSLLRLSKNVEVDTHLYTALLNQLQTIKVTKAATVGDVTIIDYAVVPLKPFKPQKFQILIISLILGLLLGMILAVIRKAMKHGVEDPRVIEKQLKLPVYATVPHSGFQKKMEKSQKKSLQEEDEHLDILALLDDKDIAIESLRSLRTTFHFELTGKKNNAVLICGPSPGIGKSFISTNIAVLLASVGKKVLLIDGDMRKGMLNKVFRVGRENGLSDLILNEGKPSEAITTIDDAGIDFMSTGPIPSNPSELLLHGHFEEVLNGFNEVYDIVLIDSPPILAVTDAMILGRMVGTSLLVVKAGEHTIDELQLCVKRFKQNSVDIKGVVVNDLPLALASFGYEKYSY